MRYRQAALIMGCVGLCQSAYASDEVCSAVNQCLTVVGISLQNGAVSCADGVIRYTVSPEQYEVSGYPKNRYETLTVPHAQGIIEAIGRAAEGDLVLIRDAFRACLARAFPDREYGVAISGNGIMTAQGTSDAEEFNPATRAQFVRDALESETGQEHALIEEVLRTYVDFRIHAHVVLGLLRAFGVGSFLKRYFPVFINHVFPDTKPRIEVKLLYRLNGPAATSDEEGTNRRVDFTFAYTIEIRITLKAAPLLACEDGVDNDGDTRIDFPSDPGCTSPKDDDEWDEKKKPIPACRDTRDNDKDGLVDHPADCGCNGPHDTSEEGGAIPCCRKGWEFWFRRGCLTCDRGLKRWFVPCCCRSPISLFWPPCWMCRPPGSAASSTRGGGVLAMTSSRTPYLFIPYEGDFPVHICALARLQFSFVLQAAVSPPPTFAAGAGVGLRFRGWDVRGARARGYGIEARLMPTLSDPQGTEPSNFRFPIFVGPGFAFEPLPFLDHVNSEVHLGAFFNDDEAGGYVNITLYQGSRRPPHLPGGEQ